MSIKISFLFITVIICGLFTACSFNTGNKGNSTVANSNVSTRQAEKSAEPLSQNINSNSETANNSSCRDLKRNGFALDKKQTSALDFTPFEKSCFAVFHDPEFTDPALGSQYFVYKDGKEIFNFPEQFNGGNATCWVDVVTFENVNGDRLKDIIVIGKCGAKSGAYNENMVYINTGKDFKVNKDANMEMMDFSKIGQIKDYIREHQESFAK